jgi:hypothetical protein
MTTETAKTPHLYDRLSGPEKAAITRSWKRFSRSLEAVWRADEAPDETDHNLATAMREAFLLEELATRRAAYLTVIRDVWFRLTWRMGGEAPDPILPAEMFENGQDIDHNLWEEWPGNLFQALEEEAYPDGLLPA